MSEIPKNTSDTQTEPAVVNWPAPTGEPIAREFDAHNGLVAYYGVQAAEFDKQLDTDAKTGLHNERWLNNRLKLLTSQEDENKTGGLGIVMFDFDGFKKINDTLGHGFGDRILAFTGKRLGAFVRSSDEKGHLDIADYTSKKNGIRKHGDEFYVLVEDLNNVRQDGGGLSVEDRLRLVASRIQAGLVASVTDPKQEDFRRGDDEIDEELLKEAQELSKSLREAGLTFGVSTGTAVYTPRQGVEAFLHVADQAMYADKHARGGAR